MVWGRLDVGQYKYVPIRTGWNESQENMERKRVELAKAFEEFKASNPYATVQDQY